MKVCAGIVLTGAALLCPDISGTTVILAWDANKETNIAGYRIYYGPTNSIPRRVDAGNKTSATLTNLPSGFIYVFYATAYNTAGLESNPSLPVFWNSPLDSDGDGIPDDYEIAHGLDPHSAADANIDSDGDGFTNLEEYLAGTDGQSGESGLRITAVLDDPGGIKIEFNSVPGKSYSIESNDIFPADSWQKIQGLAATGIVTDVIDPRSSNLSGRIYRVTTPGAAQQVIASVPAGFQRLPFGPASDTITSIPFLRPAVFRGKIASISGNILRINGAAWAPNQWAYQDGIQTNTYFLLLTSGAREGDFFTISNNDQSSVLLDPEDSSLQGLGAGDRIAVVPYWTLGTIFPAGQGIFTCFTPGSRRTEILFPDLASSDIDLTTKTTYYFWRGAWHAVGEGQAIKNDDVILPDMFVWVRNNATNATSLVAWGELATGKWRLQVERNPFGKRDIFISLPRPFPVSLNDSGLLESGVFRPSPDAANVTDELRVFDNRVLAKNKLPTATYYYSNGRWRQTGLDSLDAGNTLVFLPGSGVILRTDAGTASAVWTNQPE